MHRDARWFRGARRPELERAGLGRRGLSWALTATSPAQVGSVPGACGRRVRRELTTQGLRAVPQEAKSAKSRPTLGAFLRRLSFGREQSYTHLTKIIRT